MLQFLLLYIYLFRKRRKEKGNLLSFPYSGELLLSAIVCSFFLRCLLYALKDSYFLVSVKHFFHIRLDLILSSWCSAKILCLLHWISPFSLSVGCSNERFLLIYYNNKTPPLKLCPIKLPFLFVPCWVLQEITSHFFFGSNFYFAFTLNKY
ncbi:hypothetical protein ACH5RR_027069 [Cinchona calisaya]|uniref:Uncharacterized protein n=1 Tax=Cinchona calisaya TaxID=153742 RepID=A0ABD2Z8B3_9GENT